MTAAKQWSVGRPGGPEVGNRSRSVSGVSSGLVTRSAVDEDGAWGLVDCRFLQTWSRWPLAVATVWGGCLETRVVVRPGMLGSRFLWRAVVSVEMAGENMPRA